jgi:hypothetical protein
MMRPGSAGSNTAADHLLLLREAIGKVSEAAWKIAVDGKGQVRERRADGACPDPRCAHRKCWTEEAHVAQLTGLLREGPGGDRLKGWPKTIRVFGRREPAPRHAVVPAGGRRGLALLPVGHQSARRDQGWRGQCAYIDAAHRVHARVEDVIRTGKNTGPGHFLL